MPDLNDLLAIRARTGRLYGRTAAEEQMYFEVFAGGAEEAAGSAIGAGLRAAAGTLRAALGRVPARRARLT